MAENNMGPGEITSRKRKLEPQLQKPPLPKYMCGTSPRGTSSSSRARRVGGNSSTINSIARARSSRTQPVLEYLTGRSRYNGLNLCNIYEDCQQAFDNNNGYTTSEEVMNHNARVLLRLFGPLRTPHDVPSYTGTWLVNQEARRESGPKTIEEEFEEYFSMLLL